MLTGEQQHIHTEIFSSERLQHGFFSRHGGKSGGNFASLNVGLHVGDNLEHVYENRSRLKRQLGLEHLISAKQVHGDVVLLVDGKISAKGDGHECDAMVTNVSGIGLMIQHADCQAVMLHDPVQNIISNIHVGWRGSVLNIIGKTISEMTKHFGTHPGDLLAAVSPSLGPCCAEFVNYQIELPAELHRYRVNENHFDFWAISRDQLQSLGVKKENIDVARVCTKCSDDFFSYRRNRTTGRCASVIGLK